SPRLVSAGGGDRRRRLREQRQSAPDPGTRLALCLWPGAHLEVRRRYTSERPGEPSAQETLPQSRFLQTHPTAASLLGRCASRQIEHARRCQDSLVETTA